MKTIRTSVFETNSSSEHCLTLSTEPRQKEEFPALTDDGVLELEVTRFWECSDECDTEILRDIMEYIAVLADACNDTESGLRMIQRAYEEAGLAAPKSIYLYVVDELGKRIKYTDEYISADRYYDHNENKDKYEVTIYVDFDEEENKRCADVLKKMGKDPEYYLNFGVDEFLQFRNECPYVVTTEQGMPIGECPFITHPVGISANCLTDCTLNASMQFADNGDLEMDGTESFATALKCKSKLYFIHT